MYIQSSSHIGGSPQCISALFQLLYTPSCCQTEKRGGLGSGTFVLHSSATQREQSFLYLDRCASPVLASENSKEVVRIPIEGLFFGWQYFTLYSKINHIGRGKNNKYRIHSKLDNNKEKMKSFLKKTTQQKSLYNNYTYTPTKPNLP